MKCPKCDSIDTKVTDTRVSPEQTYIRRRRKCIECGYRFSTIETYSKTELVVVKRNGSEEDFEPEKISVGLRKAIKSDETSEKKIETAMHNILHRVHSNHPKKISTQDIGQIVMQELKQMDLVAYLRFASIYKNFLETRDFEQEVKNLKTD